MHYEESDIRLFIILANIILLGAGFMIWKLMRAQINNRHLYDRNLITAKLEMQELTMQRISQELHDNVNNSLSISRVHMQMLEESTGLERNERVRSSIELLEKAMREIKDISRSLNSEWITGMGLPYALENEIDKLKATGLFTVQSKFSEVRVVLDAQKELLIFRIVQEAINNIIKHAEAKNISISLQYCDDHADLTIIDDGKGFWYRPLDKHSKGTGLQNLESRAKGLHAELYIISRPGNGTRINLLIPYDANKNPFKKGGFNFFERLMLQQAHPPIILINLLAFGLVSYFLTEKLLIPTLITLLLTIIARVTVAWKLDLQKLAQKTIGKAMIMHAKPVNVIFRTVGLIVLLYGSWLDNNYVAAGGGILIMLTLAMVSKKERDKLKV